MSESEYEYEKRVNLTQKESILSTGSKEFDSLLNGGLRTGQITEIYGPSGSGKSTIVLQLALQVQLPVERGGLEGSCLIISTTKRPSVKRLVEIFNHSDLYQNTHSNHSNSQSNSQSNSHFNLQSNHSNSGYPNEPPDYASAVYDWLDNIHILEIRDLETLLHLLRYQIPLSISRNHFKLLVIDSINSNFRGLEEGGSTDIINRSKFIFEISTLLRLLANVHDIVIIFTNEVSANFNSLVSVGSCVQGPRRDTFILESLYENVPALGSSLANAVNTRICFNRRRMHLISCPFAEDLVMDYSIEAVGIVPTSMPYSISLNSL